ncbi:hypothetical protein RHGRI_015424 [Rhododendron griersonianum]|uniref:Uncharacterized protein n=1 Tax=Rhododendron griersonianum TaxID=479676 RepID=A0AAV6KD83_9ERIC|nr:hypothetical protein RHGRI_015424 [Rhododendron griersonianum]
MKSSLQLNLNVNVSVVEGFNLEFVLSFTQRFVPPLFSRLVVSRNEKEADRHTLSREDTSLSLLFVVLRSGRTTQAASSSFRSSGHCSYLPHQDQPTKDDSYSDIEVTYGFRAPAPADARDEDQTNKGNAGMA